MAAVIGPCEQWRDGTILCRQAPPNEGLRIPCLRRGDQNFNHLIFTECRLHRRPQPGNYHQPWPWPKCREHATESLVFSQQIVTIAESKQ